MKTLLNTLFLVLIFVGLVTAQQTIRVDPADANGWGSFSNEYDIYGNPVFITKSVLGSGFVTFVGEGKTTLKGNESSIQNNYPKDFSKASTFSLNGGYLETPDFVSFLSRISGASGLSELTIRIALQYNNHYVSSPYCQITIKNPAVGNEWQEIKIDMTDTKKRLPNFNKVYIEVWGISLETGTYVMYAIDFDDLSIISLGKKTVIDNMSITKIEGNNIPSKFELSQNYPNPFNPATKIQFSVPNSQFVSLKVYDMLGKEIATLVNEFKPIGNYEVAFNASNLPSGMYLYRLQAGSVVVETKKMLLIK